MDRISCTNKITNKDVLMRLGEKRSVIETIVFRKKNLIGRIRGDGLMKEVIEGKMDWNWINGTALKISLREILQ